MGQNHRKASDSFGHIFTERRHHQEDLKTSTPVFFVRKCGQVSDVRIALFAASSNKSRSEERRVRGSIARIMEDKIGDGCELSESEERRVRRSIAGIMEDKIGDGCDLSESEERRVRRSIARIMEDKIGNGCELSENEERLVRRSIAGIMEDKIGDGCELSESDQDHGGQGWRWM